VAHCRHVNPKTGEVCGRYLHHDDWVQDWQARCRRHLILPRKDLAIVQSSTLGRAIQTKCVATRNDGSPCAAAKMGASEWGFCLFHHKQRIREQRKAEREEAKEARRSAARRPAGGFAAHSSAAAPDPRKSDD
jgi:hypothetical protein